MKRKLFLLPTLAIMLLASCNNSTPTKHHFNVGCVNCTANFENSLSIDVNENEYATFDLLSNENYLLPVDIKVTSGNLVLTKNVDYIYSLSDDRLTGKVIIKSTDATDIYIEADEQGYLYIGNNKISKSGDYSKLDLISEGDIKEEKKIVYDYKTNTLTLSNTLIFAEKVGLSEYTVPFESESATFSSLISWTGGGTLNVELNGLNYIVGDEEAVNDCGIICPFLEGKINVTGPGVGIFRMLEEAAIMNTRGKTVIDNVHLESSDLGEFGICSRELQVSNSNLKFINSVFVEQSVGIYANDFSLSNSHCSVSDFTIGSKATRLVVINSFIESDASDMGLFCDWINTFGYMENGIYTTKIHARGENFGISTYDAMHFNNTEIVAVAGDGGRGLITVDTEILANNCSIYAEAPGGEAIHAFYLDFIDSDIIASAEGGVGIITSLHGAQGIGRENEPVLSIDNSNVIADGGIAIFGYGHATVTNCTNIPKYLEVETEHEFEQYLWGFTADSETELKYNKEFDPESGQHYYVPTNALKHVSIHAKNNQPEQRQTVTHICDLEKTARLGLGKEVNDKTSYYDYENTLEIWNLYFRKTFGDSSDQIQLEYNVFLYHRYIAVPTFTIVIIDKDGNEIGAFRNHYGCGEGIGRVTFTRDYCVRGNELAIHSFIEDYKETGLQNYQVYLESISID